MAFDLKLIDPARLQKQLDVLAPLVAEYRQGRRPFVTVEEADQLGQLWSLGTRLLEEVNSQTKDLHSQKPQQEK